MSESVTLDVLLATYKADERLLKEQIDSIVAQQGVKVNLLRHEDEEGLGACGNFDFLLRQSKADYVSFSDQDDVWCPEKLLKCLVKLRELESRYGKSTPLLVFCDGWVTDAELKTRPGTVLSRQRVDIKRGIRFNRLLMQNFVAGNSMVFNAALREKAGRIPEVALMHDAWMILVASAFGHVGFVDEPLYYYRQHSRNVLGATDAGVSHYLKRAGEGRSSFRARLADNIREARGFVDRFGEDAPDCVRALAQLPNRGWLVRRWTILHHRLFKHGLMRNIALLLFV